MELTPIHGIPCSIRSAKIRRAIVVVLDRIVSEYPEDWEIIRSAVAVIRPVQDSLCAQGLPLDYIGCHIDDQKAVEFAESLEGPDYFEAYVVGVVAHEFGHAAYPKSIRSYDDFLDIHPLGGGKEERIYLVHELIANRNAYRWKFGRQVRAMVGRPPGLDFVSVEDDDPAFIPGSILEMSDGTLNEITPTFRCARPSFFLEPFDEGEKASQHGSHQE